MSGQYNSASDYLRSLSEMADGNYTSFYRSLNGQLMFPDGEDKLPGDVDHERPSHDPEPQTGKTS